MLTRLLILLIILFWFVVPLHCQIDIKDPGAREVTPAAE